VRNVQMDYDEEVCHRAERHLFDLARRDEQNPFMLFVSFTHPHDPYQCLAEHWDRYHHDDIDMPVVSNIDPADDDPYSLRLRALSGLDKYQPSEEQTRIARHAYYGSISYLDDLVGRLLKTLEAAGFAEDTVIIFTSDHGDNLGERGLWYKKNFFEDSARVPLLLKVPGVDASRVNQHVSLVDLMPTLMDLADAGDDAVEPLDGASLAPLMSDPASPWKSHVLVENLAEGACAPAVMIREKNLKYIHCELDPPLLFDLDKDPQELNNVASVVEYADARASLETAVHTHWDLEKLDRDIKLSQARRLMLREVLATGQRTSWDYVAPDQAEEQCLRSTAIYNNWAYDQVLGLKPGPQ